MFKFCLILCFSMDYLGRDFGFDVFKGQPCGNLDVLGVLRESGYFRRGTFNRGDSSVADDVVLGKYTPREDCVRAICCGTEHSSLPFEMARRNVKDVLGALASYVFRRYEIPLSGRCLDVGCGPTGYMVEELLPISSENKDDWVQIDVNSEAVEENKRRHPGSRVLSGSYLNLGVSDYFDVVTGLSSLDTTAFPGMAIAQIRDALKARTGTFVHIQDVSPTFIPPLQEMVLSGGGFPFEVEVMDPAMFNCFCSGHLAFPQNIISYVHGDGEPLVVVELFRRRLGRALLEIPGMETLVNEWFTFIGRSDDSNGGCAYNSGCSVVFPGLRYKIASAVVTVARRG